MISRMPTENDQSATKPLCGGDLEGWRCDNKLSKVEAADAFGLQKVKWDELTSEDHASEPLTDPTVAMLLEIYRSYPKSSPIRPQPDIKEFFVWLGLQEDQPQDYTTFAALIGRAPPTVYRHIRPPKQDDLHTNKSKPSRPVLRWIEALCRLNLTPRQTLKLMVEVVAMVGQRQRAGNVLSEGWSRQGAAVEPTD